MASNNLLHRIALLYYFLCFWIYSPFIVFINNVFRWSTCVCTYEYFHGLNLIFYFALFLLDNEIDKAVWTTLKIFHSVLTMRNKNYDEKYFGQFFVIRNKQTDWNSWWKWSILIKQIEYEAIVKQDSVNECTPLIDKS